MVVATSMPVVVTMIHKVAEETETLPAPVVALVVVLLVVALAAAAAVLEGRLLHHSGWPTAR